MDVIMVGPWMLFSQSGLDHGRHECFLRLRTDETMDVIMSLARMCSSQNELDHGRQMVPE